MIFSVHHLWSVKHPSKYCSILLLMLYVILLFMFYTVNHEMIDVLKWKKLTVSPVNGLFLHLLAACMQSMHCQQLITEEKDI